MKIRRNFLDIDKTTNGNRTASTDINTATRRNSLARNITIRSRITVTQKRSSVLQKRRDSNWENRNLKLTTTTKRKRCHQRVPRQWSGSFSSFTYNLCRRDQIAESYRFFTPFVQADVLLRSAKERRRTRRNSDGKHEL